MRITYQLGWLQLAVITSLVLIVHCTFSEEPAVEAPTLINRDNTANYVVYPKDATNKDQATAINNLLEGLVSDKSKIYISNTDKVTLFLSAPLTSDNAQKVGSDSNVGAIVKECTSNCGDPTGGGDWNNEKRSDDEAPLRKRSRLLRRDDGTVNSHKVEPEVAFTSWPDQTELGEDFVYDKSAGSGVTVYIVDTGVGLVNTAEFSKYVAGNIRYLQARGAAPSDGLENDSGIHGTTMVAKVAGWKHGVAKRSKVVMARVSEVGDPGAWLDGLRQVYNDWEPTYNKNPKTATAVVNLSWGFTNDGLSRTGYTGLIGDVWKGELALLINQCIDIGLVPVMPSGNGPPAGLPVNQYPQLFLYPSNGDPPVVTNALIVGGVTTDGNLSPRSLVDPPNTPRTIKLYAPNTDITVPYPDRQDFRLGQGTSLAAAVTSGLGTYFLGLSSLSTVLSNDDPVKRVSNVINFLVIGSSVARGNNNPQLTSIWNLADPRACPPGAEPPGFTNGDEIPCADTSSTKGDTVLAISGCFITTVGPIPSLGLNAPSSECSCQDGVIAGIGSGTVSGTTYSWCETSPFPTAVPTQATIKGGGAAPPSSAAAPMTVPLKSQCLHVFTNSPTSTATCSTSTSIADPAKTSLANGFWTCYKAGLGSACVCEVGGQEEPCLPADQIAAGGKRDMLEFGPMPTKVPGRQKRGLTEILGNF